MVELFLWAPELGRAGPSYLVALWSSMSLCPPPPILAAVAVGAYTEPRVVRTEPAHSPLASCLCAGQA